MAKANASTTNTGNLPPDEPGTTDTSNVPADPPAAAPASELKPYIRMKVKSILPFVDGTATVTLEAVTHDSPENAAFFQHAPGGKLSLPTLTEEAAKLFVLHQEYFVGFMPVEAMPTE